MTKKIFYIYILTYIFNLQSDISFAQNKKSIDFLFPIDINPVISGSFAELRSNHFHSGIDLSTNGKTGVPVKSTEKGVISRIKISPVGYGNAIYIKHPNGYTTVYGHLKNYSSKIDSIITAEQYKKETFAIDYFPTEEINIKRGEIIGYSGNSGSSGGPHLHYEIRDTKTEKPINPFLFQSIIKDDIRPKILAIRLYPLTNESSINGDSKAKSYPVVFYDGSYHLKSNPKIYATGKIGVGIKMIDYMTGSWRKCGVYKLDMFVNKQKWYGWEMERFSFAESRYINSHIDYAYKKKHGERFERCFRQPNNNLSIYNGIQHEGVIEMDSTMKINIIVADAASNLSKLDFKLLKGNHINSLHQSEPDSLALSFLYNQDNIFENESLKCFIPQGALYDNMKFKVTSSTNDNDLPAYMIGDDNIPLHKSISISIRIPDFLKQFSNKLALANQNGAGHLSYAGGTINGDFIELKTKYFGKYTFAMDTVPPTIKPTTIIKGKTISKRTNLYFKIRDDFSGIKSFNGYLNEEWSLFQYDAKTNTLICPLSKALVKGGHIELKLIVIDNCGNQDIFKSKFILK